MTFFSPFLCYVKLLYLPECVSKHKVYDRNYKLISYYSAFEKFIIKNNKEGINVDKKQQI